MSVDEAAPAPCATPGVLRTVLVLGRTSNLPTVWTNVLAGWFLAGGTWDWQIAWLALAVSALYLGGMTLNDAFDVSWDRQHAPERPVPSGAISERGVWMLGIGWMVLGVVLTLWLADAAVGWLIGLVLAIVLYDWIHKKWSGAMWVMGACRTLVYALAASAAQAAGAESLSAAMHMDAALSMGIALGIYVAGITLCARSERQESTAGRARKVALFLLGVPLLAAALARIDLTPIGASPPPGWSVAALMAFYVWWVLWRGRQRLRENIGSGVTTLLAGIVVVDALFLSLVNWQAALICLAFLPIVRFLQQRIPAT